MKLIASTFDVHFCDKKPVNENHCVVSKKGYFGVFAHKDETKVELPIRLTEYLKVSADTLNPLIYLSSKGDELWQRLDKEGVVLGGVDNIAVAFIPPNVRSLDLLLEGESRTIKVNNIPYQGKKSGLVTVNTLYNVSMVEYEGRHIFLLKKDVEENKIAYKGKYLPVGYFSEDNGGCQVYYTSESFIQLEQGKDYVCQLLTPDGNARTNVYTRGYVPVPKGASRLHINSKMYYGRYKDIGADVGIFLERAKCAHLRLASGYRMDTGSDSVALIPEKYAKYIDSFDDDRVQTIAKVNIAAEEQDFVMYYVPHLADMLDFTDVFGMKWQLNLYPAVDDDVHNLEWKLPLCIDKTRKFEHGSIFLSSLFNNREAVLYRNSEGYIDFSTIPDTGFYVVHELLDNGTAGKALGCIMLYKTIDRISAENEYLASVCPFKEGGERIFGKHVIRTEGLETIHLDSPISIGFKVTYSPYIHSWAVKPFKPLFVGTGQDRKEAEKLGYAANLQGHNPFNVKIDDKVKTPAFTLPEEYTDGFVIKQVRKGEIHRYEWFKKEVKFDATLNTLFLIPHNGCVLKYEVPKLDNPWSSGLEEAEK